MRKFINKYMFIALAACALASCSDDDYTYVAGEQEASDRPNVYFHISDMSSSVELDPTDVTELDIPIYREKSNATQALTVPLEVSVNTESTFTVPESVTFAAGDTVATVHVTFPNAVVGTSYTLVIDVPNDYMTLYKDMGSDWIVSYKTTITRVQWNLVGTGTFTYTAFFSGDDAGLELYQRADKPEMFRIPNTLGGVNFTFTWDQKTNDVVVDDFYIGYDHSTYGSVYLNDAGGSYFDPETNTFYFNDEYTVSLGSFGSAYEMFTLDSPITTE